MKELNKRMKNSLNEIKDHIENGIIPYWLNNSVDREFGGYLTCFDEEGKPDSDTNKYIVTQTRMIWGFSAYYREYPERMDLRRAAEQGVEFLIKNFWDSGYGGWFWKVSREGKVLDAGKVVYGQSFAIYALSEFTLATGNYIGLEYAGKTFDLLQKYCADTYRGGYYENLEHDWTVSEPGFAGGDRKSLDIHMHLMEAFTALFELSKKEIHKRRLKEIIKLIIDKMIDKNTGCGLNQFDLNFNPIPAINIRRTWNAERTAGEIMDAPADTTSYGHNVELAWLLNRAWEVLNDNAFEEPGIVKKLVDHCLEYGFDHSLGGVYRDGPHTGEPYVRDKEWWQNCEVLVGFLDAFEKFNKTEYFDAFYKTWSFDRQYMINFKVGEWRQLLTKDGAVINGSIGNPWKGIYHTGRAMLECKQRLERLIRNYSTQSN